MPIRFRCVYCDKLLGIASRKAGTVVNCPQCGQPLIVPTPEPEPAPVSAKTAPASAAGPSGSVFESDDFDVLLESDPTVQAAPEPPSQPRRKTAVKPPPPATVPMPSRPYAPVPRPTAPGSSQQYAPLPLPAPSQPKGLVLSSGKILLMVGAVCFLMLVSFGVGLLVGRMLKGE